MRGVCESSGACVSRIQQRKHPAHSLCLNNSTQRGEELKERSNERLTVALSRFSCAQSVCGSFADKYVEYELILVALDLLLLKVQVYRHCLFNLSVAGLKVRSQQRDKAD